MTPQELIAQHKAEQAHKQALLDAETESGENLEAASEILDKLKVAPPAPQEPESALDISQEERWEVVDVRRGKTVFTTPDGFGVARVYGEALAEREANPAASVRSFERGKGIGKILVIAYSDQGGEHEVHIKRA